MDLYKELNKKLRVQNIDRLSQLFLSIFKGLTYFFGSKEKPCFCKYPYPLYRHFRTYNHSFEHMGQILLHMDHFHMAPIHELFRRHLQLVSLKECIINLELAIPRIFILLCSFIFILGYIE